MPEKRPAWTYVSISAVVLNASRARANRGHAVVTTKSLAMSLRDMVFLSIARYIFLVILGSDDPDVSRQCRLSFDKIEDYQVLSDMCRNSTIRSALQVEQDINDMAEIDDGAILPSRMR